MTRITRVEVIDENGRSYVNWEEDNDITLSYQDDGRTLKVFVNTMKPKTGEERALEALDKFQNDWLLGKKCPETKLEIKNLNSVESIKAEIKVLQSKLEFYEELEKTKSSVEEAYKRVYGAYPPTTPSVSNFEDTRWSVFQAGYNAAYEEKVAQEPEEEPEELKTLYQMFYENDWNVRSCEVFCDIVKEWMSQYADNVMCGEYKKGYEYCLTVLEENLKND
jgi:hypothetical protein